MAVKIDSYPAVLAAMRAPTGVLVAVHRTWLNKYLVDKARATDVMKLTHATEVIGSAVRLFDAKGATVLGLAEGIETSLFARQLAWGRYWPELGIMPVWACYSESNLRSFKIPAELLDTLEKIVIFAD